MRSCRPPLPEEFAAWRPLWQGYVDFYEASVPEDVITLTWARFFDANEPMHCIAAFEDTRMVGFVAYVLHRSTWAATSYCYLEDLFVDATVRGKGFGRALIEAVRDAARDRNCARLYWVTRKSNAQAQALYDTLAAKTDFVQYRMPLD